MPTEENNREHFSLGGERSLEVEPTGAGHAHVEQQTPATITGERKEEVAGRAVGDGLIARDAQESRHGLAETFVIVNQVNNWLHQIPTTVFSPAAPAGNLPVVLGC